MVMVEEWKSRPIGTPFVYSYVQTRLPANRIFMVCWDPKAMAAIVIEKMNLGQLTSLPQAFGGSPAQHPFLDSR
jgi:hypothetical protein